MRFTHIIFVAAMAGAAVSAPAKRNLVTDVGTIVQSIVGTPNVTAIQGALNNINGTSAELASALSLLLDKLGVTYTTQTLNLTARANPGDLQTIGAGLRLVLNGLGVTATQNFLNSLSGNALNTALDALGVSTVEQAVGLARRATPGDIQTVGAGLKQVSDGLGVTATQDYLNSLSGDALNTALDALGVNTVEQALGYQKK